MSSFDLSLYFKDVRLGRGRFGVTFQYSLIAPPFEYGDDDVPVHVAVKEYDRRTTDFLGLDLKRLQTLRHRNLVRLVGMCSSLDKVYIITELCQENLRTYHKRVKLAIDDVIHIIKEVLHGLDYLHSHCFIHGSISPTNIVLCYSFLRDSLTPEKVTFKLSDPESSRPDPKDPSTTDMCSSVLRDSLPTDAIGSDARSLGFGQLFSAPEVLRTSLRHLRRLPSDPIDVGSDIWSVGAVAFELIVGRTPFRSDQLIGVKPLRTLQVLDSVRDPQARHFLSGMFVLEPARRMSVRDLIKHPFITKSWRVILR